MRQEKSRMRGVYHWNRLPRSVIESNFNVIPTLSRGLNCKLLSQEPSKWNHSLNPHMPFVNLGSCIYVKVLTEKHIQFHNLSSFCRMTGNICVCGAVLKLLLRCLLNLTKKERSKEMCLTMKKELDRFVLLFWAGHPDLSKPGIFFFHFLPLTRRHLVTFCLNHPWKFSHEKELANNFKWDILVHQEG